MKIKSYIQNLPCNSVEMTADKDIYSKIFTEVHSSVPWVEFAIDDCSLWSFLYYLYLYCIAGYMDKPGFAVKKHTAAYEHLIKKLKSNTIDADSLTLSRDTLRGFMDDYPEIPVEFPKSLKGCTVNDALGKYYDLAVEALGCCDSAKYVNPYLTESDNMITVQDETAEHEFVYSLPQMSCRCCALAELEDTGILESKWFENNNKDGKAALYSHILELSVQSDRFDDKTLYLLDLAAKCLEPFVTGQIYLTKPHVCYAPGYLAKKFQEILDSYDEDLPRDVTKTDGKANDIE